MQSRRPRVEVITGAEQSPADQLRRRQMQYFGLMSLRVFCLILAAVLVSLDVPYALAWVVILTIGMCVFPWMAVMLANDRPPREENRFRNRFKRTPSSARALSAETEAPLELESRELPPSTARVINHDD
ncbi:DUF3099 domain-containing protein [Cryptosporangium phraense]|uniref:DUF3099 domain-containing protein n=1 Tax=Cryptosporangium phraense TaxID=2593070 RepID=UPI00147905E6|nr:DUF3099 domain-containing protein [Cryptosporangium phraense]